MRWTGALALVAACGGSKVERAKPEDVARALCGDRYQASLERRGQETRVLGCPARDGEHGVFAVYRENEDGPGLIVNVHADADGLPGAIATVEAALAKLLDRDQRAFVADQLPAILPDRFRPYRPVIGGVEIYAGTWTEALPWERRAVIELGLDAKAPARPLPPLADQLAVAAARFGWNDRLPPVDDATLARWKAACAGTWTAGDVFARCDGAEPFWAEWTPSKRALLRIHLETAGELRARVEALVTPLLSPEQRQLVEPALTADVDNVADLDALVHVASQLGGATHAITIEGEPRW